MKKHKIAIFTSLRMIPAHPRLMMEKEILIDDSSFIESDSKKRVDKNGNPRYFIDFAREENEECWN